MRLCSWWSAVLLVVVCAPPGDAEPSGRQPALRSRHRLLWLRKEEPLSGRWAERHSLLRGHLNRQTSGDRTKRLLSKFHPSHPTPRAGIKRLLPRRHLRRPTPRTRTKSLLPSARPGRRSRWVLGRASRAISTRRERRNTKPFKRSSKLRAWPGGMAGRRRPLSWYPSHTTLFLRPVWSQTTPFPAHHGATGTGKAARLFESVFKQDHATPEINVSLQKNDTDRERVDRIHNVTLLDRNTTREVQGGSEPRLARLRETQDTDDRLRRSTNTSGTERRVGVTVSIGNHPDIVIGASHATRDTNIKQNRETQQDKTNNTELYKNDGSRNESESQRRLRKSRGSVSLQETSKTFNYTFDKRKNPREAGGPPLGTTDHPLLVTAGQQLKQTATSRSANNSRPPEDPNVSRPARPSNSSLHTDFNKTSLQRKDTLPFSDSRQPRTGTEPSDQAGIDSSLRPQHHGTLLVKSSDNEPLQQVGIPSFIIQKGGDSRPATHAGISSELGSGSSFPHQHNTAGEPAGSGHGAKTHGLTHWSKSHSRSGSKS
ncbi:uncharacterized protein LOC122383865 isoform X3 [Amphibalanus amphitrite]|uniref:uncharacterized protein LOC122383865 isoform X3 n=1 Tax=Amphibalanus amphitrite TaxID=1232801 RepID=UPI001C8FFB12|nr:uncharacterized protein LOC122383865 isoform X3 [Amphibalanus amphitrite]